MSERYSSVKGQRISESDMKWCDFVLSDRANRSDKVMANFGEDWIPRLIGEVMRLRAALREIMDQSGEVCPEFEICEHPWCRSSCAAQQIADEALAEN